MVARLHRRTHFAHIRAQGTTVREGRLRVSFAEPDPACQQDGPALAFAIPRAFGTAVQRNRARRQLREIIREVDAAGQLPALWYQVSLSPGRTVDHRQLKSWFHRVLQRPELAGAG